MRQRNKPWADEFIESHTDIIIPAPMEKKGSWKEVFGNENPVHLEIGTGKGQFIVGMARKYPHINFIGIEVAKTIIVRAAQKAMDADLPNVKLLHVNAANLLEIFAEDEISQLYLNFSDPWPKNRHEKRRLTYYPFLKQYKQVLDSEGKIILKTDNQGFFEYSLVSFSQFGIKLQEVNLDLHEVDDPDNVMTEYEKRFSAKGQPIYRCIAGFKQ
ncbi:tRNA (guanosine(46)-N7)-methyltransferase TrmB [Virgibacillus kimchii]